MKEDFPHNISEEKLAKFFAGEATQEESQTIRMWANLSAENKDLLLQMQIVWIDTGHVNFKTPVTRTKYNVDAAWAKVKAKRVQYESKQRSFSWVWRVAAILVVVFAVGLLLRMILDGPDRVVLMADSEVATFELPDGTSVVLNETSSLAYLEGFEEENREVKLLGKAFFEVAHNPERPFVIQAGPTRVKVLGTSFYVNMEDNEVSVVVETGRVLFSSGKEELILTAGEAAVFSTTSKLIEERAAEAAGADRYWRTKKLRFTGQKLPQVVETLEDAYEVEITLLGENLEECSLSVTFDNDSLENILEVISLTLNLKIEETDSGIIISGKGCAEN